MRCLDVRLYRGKLFLVLLIMGLYHSMSFMALRAMERKEILLEMPIEELIRVKVVSPSKIPKSSIDAPSTVTVYTDEDIRKYGFRTLSELLWVVPGVQIYLGGNGRPVAWIRGVQTEMNNKTALFIDDIPVRDFFGGYPIDEELPLDRVKRIEIIRGPGSALYGTNAFAGVISIYTYDPGELKGGMVRAEAGNHDTKSIFAISDFQTPVGNYLVQAKAYDTEGQTPRHNRKGLPIDVSPEEDAQYVRLKGGFLDNRLLLNAAVRTFDYKRVDIEPEAHSTRDHFQGQISLGYTQPLKNEGMLTFKTYYSNTRREEVESEAWEENDILKDVEWNYVDTIELWGAKAHWTYHWGEHHTFILGGETELEHLDDSYYTEKTDEYDDEGNLISSISEDKTFIRDDEYENYTARTMALYLQDTWSLRNGRTALTAGVRHDFRESFEDVTSYRLGLVNHFSDNIFGKLLYGTAFRAPSFLEFTRNSVGAEKPKTEKMETAEAQIGYHNVKTLCTLTLFHNTYEDYIERVYVKDLDTENFGNTDTRKMYGLEFDLHFNPFKSLNTFVNVSWLNAENTSLDEDLPLLAPYTFSAGFNWSYPAGPGHFLVDNYIYGYGNRKDLDESVQRYPGRKDSYTDGFVIWNGGIRYKLSEGLFKDMEFFFHVWNILDKEHYDQNLVQWKNRAYWDVEYARRTYLLALSYEW